MRLAEAAHHLEAVHTGHHHVGHQHIGFLPKEALQAFFPVFGEADAEALTLQGVLDNHGEGGFVFH